MKSSPFFMKLSTDCLTPWHTGIRAELTIIIPTLLMNCVKPSPRAVMVPNCPSRAISRPNRPMNIPNWTQGLEVILLARRKQTLTASLKDVSDYKERDIIITITIGLELTTFILVASPSMATSMTWPSSVLLISWKAEPRLLRWPWATLSSSKVVPGERNMRIWQWHHQMNCRELRYLWASHGLSWWGWSRSQTVSWLSETFLISLCFRSKEDILILELYHWMTG